MYIGQRLKQLRKQMKMTLVDVAKRSGVQVATLSRIENMKMVGSLDSHIKIAKALGVEITELYRDIIKEEPTIDIQKEAAADIFIHNDRSSHEILTKNVLSKKMMPTLVKIDPGGQGSTEQDFPGTEKFVYVLEGRIMLQIDKEKIALSPTHSVYFDSTKKHTLLNKGKTKAKILCVSTPVNL
jgi:transcriptional regulator with XRE-family HTH domain